MGDISSPTSSSSLQHCDSVHLVVLEHFSYVSHLFMQNPSFHAV